MVIIVWSDWRHDCKNINVVAEDDVETDVKTDTERRGSKYEILIFSVDKCKSESFFEHKCERKVLMYGKIAIKKCYVLTFL